MSDYDYYNKLSYRICYGLTEDGKMDYSKPLYEFTKYCNCDLCTKRFKYDDGLTNVITVATDDKMKFADIEKIIMSYTCNEKQYIGRKYIALINGEERVRVFL